MTNVDDQTQPVSAADEADAWVTKFGARVREMRRAKGLRQVQVAERMGHYGAGIHQTTVAKIESASRPTTIRELWVLSRALKCDVEDLLPGEAGTDDQRLEATKQALEMAEIRVGELERAYKRAQAALAEGLEQKNEAERRRDEAARAYLERRGKER